MDIRIVLREGKCGEEVKEGMVWYHHGWVTYNVIIQVKENGKWVDVPVIRSEDIKD
jgi:hypothetical protein